MSAGLEPKQLSSNFTFMSKNKFYITTSIAYANASPHIGYAMEVLQADALARYHRMLGEDVYFLTGTDENGSKIKRTAEEKGVETREFVNEISARFQMLLDVLNISNDDFIRTSDVARHYPSAQMIWNKLAQAGDIYKGNYEGYYCVGCEEYMTEKDLIGGKCPYHKKEPERIKEENYFFKLSKYTDVIIKEIESGELEINPQSRKNEILNVLRSGLKDISFSRPKTVLDWGVPVPNDEHQTIYVWCDALANYISALGYADSSGKFKKYWPADIHLIGKDILRFHAAIWPGMLISSGLPLPKKIYVHGHITSQGQKMSKSLGNVVDPFEMVDKFGVDALRYYLLKEIPSGDDGDFSQERFIELYNGELANGLGNLAARIFAMAEKIKSFELKAPSENSSLKTDLENTWLKYENNIDKFKLNEAILEIWRFIAACDLYIEKNKPWQLEEEKKIPIIYNLLESLRQITWMLYPFMPETSSKILSQLFADENYRKIELNKNLQEAKVWGGLKSDIRIKREKVLFPHIEE